MIHSKYLTKLGSALYMLYVLFIFIHTELDGIVYGRGSCVKSPIMDTNIVIFILFYFCQLSLQLSVYNQITRISIFHFYRADLRSPAWEGGGGGGSFEPPLVTGLKRIKLVLEPRIFKLKTAQARSGAPHFHARPRARSGAIVHFHFAAAHTYQNLG